MDNQTIKASALRTIQTEAGAITGLQQFINEDFFKVVHLLKDCRGKVIVSGVGKSALIAQKIVATFNSTGTPGVFLHAADAIHGDLGMVQPEDIVIIISKSGDSPEIKALVPFIKNFGNLLVAMVGNTASYLAKNSNYIINTTVEMEACPNNLAPTSSTTAQMVMGDALAVCLMELNGFNSDHFAKYHPGGTLGKKLYLKVNDLIGANEKPQVTPLASIKEVIVEMTQKRLGATAVVEQNKICGIITDGDIRRMLEKSETIAGLHAKDIMTTNPKIINSNSLAVEALELLTINSISQLPAVQDDGTYTGIVHIHDLIREGII